MLFLTMLLFLLGALVGPSKLTYGGCKTVAILLQYCLLAAFAWMLSEGHLLLSGIRNPFAAAGKKSIRRYTVMSCVDGTPPPLIVNSDVVVNITCIHAPLHYCLYTATWL
jgi:hypothetical protein